MSGNYAWDEDDDEDIMFVSRHTPGQTKQPANTSDAKHTNGKHTNASQRSNTPLFLPEEENSQGEVIDVDAIDEAGPITEATHQDTPVVDDVDWEASSMTEAVFNITKYVSQICEIIPDVLRGHVEYLVNTHIEQYRDNVVEPILHQLFEDNNYPKADRKGKRKRDVQDEGSSTNHKKAKPSLHAYETLNRAGPAPSPTYINMALDQLMADFPVIPRLYIHQQLVAHASFYVPTFIALSVAQKRVPLPYIPASTPFQPKGKGKARIDAHFQAEYEWLQQSRHVTSSDNDRDAEPEEDPNGLECGCCFSTYTPPSMIQCPDAHLFCKSCIRSYASTLLSSHNTSIVCIDQPSSCTLPISASELARALDDKLLALYHRVKQQKEIEMAKLEGLEECPFCEYKVVMENEEEKLFRCEGEDCGAVSCRKCKKLDHLPKSCQEVEEDKVLDGRHSIEEAMTQALMRNCPQCKKAFVKEGGCNKMTCPQCGTLSCYVCRSIIKGYQHFTVSRNGKPPCGAYDNGQDIDVKIDEDVKAAAQKALAEYKQTHPDVDDAALKVDLPAPRPGPRPEYDYLAGLRLPELHELGLRARERLVRARLPAMRGPDELERGALLRQARADRVVATRFRNAMRAAGQGLPGDFNAGGRNDGGDNTLPRPLLNVDPYRMGAGRNDNPNPFPLPHVNLDAYRMGAGRNDNPNPFPLHHVNLDAYRMGAGAANGGGAGAGGNNNGNAHPLPLADLNIPGYRAGRIENPNPFPLPHVDLDVYRLYAGGANGGAGAAGRDDDNANPYARADPFRFGAGGANGVARNDNPHPFPLPHARPILNIPAYGAGGAGAANVNVNANANGQQVAAPGAFNYALPAGQDGTAQPHPLHNLTRQNLARAAREAILFGNANGDDVEHLQGIFEYDFGGPNEPANDPPLFAFGAGGNGNGMNGNANGNGNGNQHQHQGAAFAFGGAGNALNDADLFDLGPANDIARNDNAPNHHAAFNNFAPPPPPPPLGNGNGNNGNAPPVVVHGNQVFMMQPQPQRMRMPPRFQWE